MQKLSPRLKFLFDQLKADEEVWDLFCDHGYLGEAALKSGRFAKIHFNDQIPEIINALKLRLSDEGYDLSQTSFHACDASALDWSNVSGTVVMAGVGVELILQVFQASLQTKTIPTRYLFAPQNHPEKLELVLKTRSLKYQVHQIDERGRTKDIFIVDSVK